MCYDDNEEQSLVRLSSSIDALTKLPSLVDEIAYKIYTRILSSELEMQKEVNNFKKSLSYGKKKSMQSQMIATYPIAVLVANYTEEARSSNGKRSDVCAVDLALSFQLADDVVECVLVEFIKV